MDDEVVLQATGNTMAIVRLLKPYVGRVVVANPLQVRVIADAKAKTDRIDAAADVVEPHRAVGQMTFGQCGLDRGLAFQ